jgi:hypothetical protein
MTDGVTTSNLTNKITCQSLMPYFILLMPAPTAGAPLSQSFAKSEALKEAGVDEILQKPIKENDFKRILINLGFICYNNND